MVWKMIFLFQGARILRFHVNLPGCNVVVFKIPASRHQRFAKHSESSKFIYLHLVDFYGKCRYIYLGLSPLQVTVTTRIITFLVGNPEKNLHFPPLLGGGTTQYIPYMDPVGHKTAGSICFSRKFHQTS